MAQLSSYTRHRFIEPVRDGARRRTTGQVDVAKIAGDFGDSLGVIVACVDGQRSERQFKRLGIVFRAVTASQRGVYLSYDALNCYGRCKNGETAGTNVPPP